MCSRAPDLAPKAVTGKPGQPAELHDPEHGQGSDGMGPIQEEVGSSYVAAGL